MRAVGIRAYGRPEALELMTVPEPVPGPQEVLVRQAFSGVNFVDVYMRRGDYARSSRHGGDLPMILGREGAGEVVRIGADVSGVKPGDRVAWCITQGTYAEYSVVPAWRLVPVPADVPLDIACALQLQGATAHFLATSTFPLKPGDTALIHAGAGGVGQLLIQMAKATGAIVITTVGTDEKAALVRRLGADHAIVSAREDFAARTLELTAGLGCHVVYDAVGRDTIAGSIRACRRRGLVVLYGGASGAVDAVSPQLLAESGSLFFTRPHLGDHMQDADEVRQRSEEVLSAWREGNLKVAIDRVLPLAAAREAHALLEGRATSGKLLLKVTA